MFRPKKVFDVGIFGFNVARFVVHKKNRLSPKNHIRHKNNTTLDRFWFHIFFVKFRPEDLGKMYPLLTCTELFFIHGWSTNGELTVNWWFGYP